MPRAAADPNKLTGLASRLSAFVTERHPLALQVVLDVFDHVGGSKLKPRDHAGLEAMRGPFRRELARRLYATLQAPDGTDQTTPGTTAIKRMEQARAELSELQARMHPLQREINQLTRQFWVDKAQVAANKYDLSASRYRLVERDEAYYEQPDVTIDRLLQLDQVMRAETQELLAML